MKNNLEEISSDLDEFEKDTFLRYKELVDKTLNKINHLVDLRTSDENYGEMYLFHLLGEIKRGINESKLLIK